MPTDEDNITEENKWIKKTPLLRKSLFPNISPFINFISQREEYEQTFEEERVKKRK